MAVAPQSSGELLREARTKAGLTQEELATRAGVAQSVVSVYESGRRQPSVATLASLVEATGYRLDLAIRRQAPSADPFTGPVGQRVRVRRVALNRIAQAHGVHVIGVFGSVARGEDRPDSDLDLLVDLPADMGLIGLGRLRADLERAAGVVVDVVPEADLKPGVRGAVLGDLVPL